MGRISEAMLCSAVPIEESAFRLIEYAQHPRRISILVDPSTQDRILVYYFEDRPPSVIRMTVDEILRARSELLRLEMRFLN